MRFVAVDVETANPDMSSICQIGIVTFDNGVEIEKWSSLVDPQDYFSDINSSIHGIFKSDIKGKPNFSQVYKEISSRLSGEAVVIHSHFDRTALRQVCQKYNLAAIECAWLDTARIARRTWLELSKSGYGLSNVCKFIGHEFQHHDALEDAIAAGRVFLAACNETGLDISGWQQRIKQPIDISNGTKGGIKRDGDIDGPLYGEVITFTGALEIPRKEAADLAAKLGLAVSGGVTKKTTILCIGDQDASKLGGHEKSAKHRKAEELIDKGQKIRIIIESDFAEMTGIA